MNTKKTPKVNGILYDTFESGGGLSDDFDRNLSKRNQNLNKKGKEKKKSEDIKRTKKRVS